jgi:hypothetical protein
MDDKGYVFTPLTLLLIIPVIIVAISYGEIGNELNMLSSMAMGGDTTYTTTVNIYTAIERGAADAGRYSAYNATRKVIDDKKFFSNSTGSDSRSYMTTQIQEILNEHVISSCKELELQTGRQIYINGTHITNSTYEVISNNSIEITQEDPFGFYVKVKGGIPIKVVQNDQSYEGSTPDISAYISIEGLEDPYIWLNSNYNETDLIYSYPHYTSINLGNGTIYSDYHFDEITPAVSKDNRLHYLYECLDGDINATGITPESYYFPDPNGLSFFDRLNNQTTSTDTVKARMSTFILGDPLFDAHGNVSAISHLDHEYFAKVPGSTITITQGNTPHPFLDPSGWPFYISDSYRNYFNLQSSYAG